MARNHAKAEARRRGAIDRSGDTPAYILNLLFEEPSRVTCATVKPGHRFEIALSHIVPFNVLSEFHKGSFCETALKFSRRASFVEQCPPETGVTPNPFSRFSQCPREVNTFKSACHSGKCHELL